MRASALQPTKRRQEKKEAKRTSPTKTVTPSKRQALVFLKLPAAANTLRILVMEKEGLISPKKRPLETTEAVDNSRREKRQKMGKKNSKKSEERKKLEKRLRGEAMEEIKPIAIGSIAMIASTLSNQGEEGRQV